MGYDPPYDETEYVNESKLKGKLLELKEDPVYVVERALASLEALDPQSDANKRLLEIAATGVRIVRTLLEKNSAYGSTVFESPVLMPNLSPAAAILVRISDKIGRFINLYKNTDLSQNDEPLADTVLDLAGYFILLSVWLKERQNASS